MISALTGELRRVDEDRLYVQVGPLLVEMLVPAADVPLLQAGVGQEMTFHTILYFEGDAAGGGGLEPRLVGFLRPEDKRFFDKFITVKGIGPKKALKALVQAAPHGQQAPLQQAAEALFGKVKVEESTPTRERDLPARQRLEALVRHLFELPVGTTPSRKTPSPHSSSWASAGATPSTCSTAPASTTATSRPPRP